ncbi:MAG: hypothetical protein N3J91_05205 [Verrucomicrobiae bacterium]|nr:hypothetical protein [Verrucomicrobiae bacterium]
MKRKMLLCLLMVCAGGGYVTSQENQGGDSYDEVGLEQRISPAMMRWFRAGVPADAAGLGIALGKVLSVKVARFCPQGGPHCGLAPACGHGNLTWGTSSSYQINGMIIRRQGVKMPEKIENYLNAPGANTLRAGEDVWIAFHTLKTNQAVRIALVERVPKTNSPPATNGPVARP